MMEREYVCIDESNISHISYDEDKQVVGVEYSSNGSCEYFDIPDKIHKEVMAASDMAEYLGYYIKKYHEFDGKGNFHHTEFSIDLSNKTGRDYWYWYNKILELRKVPSKFNRKEVK